MSGVYGKVRAPGSKFTIIAICFVIFSQSAKEDVRRDLPEPAVPIMNTVNIS
jgi:hypothetical protein